MTQPAAARKPLALALGLLAVAMIVAVVVGVNWWGRHTAHERAAARDAAVDGARQAVIDIQTFDPSDIPTTLNRIGQAMTGQLRQDWDDRDRAFTEDRLKERVSQNFRTEPNVVACAPTEFSADERTAKVLVYLVQKFWIDGKASDDAYRWTYLVTVDEVDGHWKASALVPIQEAGTSRSSNPTASPAPTSATSPRPEPAQEGVTPTTTETPMPTEPSGSATTEGGA